MILRGGKMAGYVIGSDKGKKIASGMKSGDTYKASDGSTWKKNSDGSVSVTTKNGGYTANALSGSSSSSSKKSGGGSSTGYSTAPTSGISATYGTQSANGMDQFYANNMDRINGIANANGVDINTAKSMLISNINGTGNYAGGGIANMGALSNAYKNALAYDRRNNNANMGNLGNTQMSTQYQNLLDQQLKAQQEAIAKQTQATVDSINAYKPQIQQAYEQQQKANYIANAKSKASLNDYLKAMGYSGGMAESTLANIDAQYLANRAEADTEKNNALEQVANRAAQAQISGDTSLAELMGDYYNNYLNALQNQQQTDYDNYANSIGAYYQDYQAEINRLLNMGVPEDDYRIKLLRQARNEKLQAMAQAEAEAEQQAFANSLKQQQVNYQINKPYYKPTTARTSTGGGGAVNAVTGLNW